AFATRWGAVVMNQGLLQRLSRREVDAIVCHELSHMRPLRRSRLMVAYGLIVAAVLGQMWLPNFFDVIPALLLIAYFLVKAWRRAGGRTADLDAVRRRGDPEAMITGLARVSRENGMPLEWAAPYSWVTAHPSTMERIHAIARAGQVSQPRIGELLEEAQQEAADHYAETQPPAAPIPDDAAFSPAIRHRLQMRLTWYTLLAPIALGMPIVWMLERIGLSRWAVL